MKRGPVYEFSSNYTNNKGIIVWGKGPTRISRLQNFNFPFTFLSSYIYLYAVHYLNKISLEISKKEAVFTKETVILVYFSLLW